MDPSESAPKPSSSANSKPPSRVARFIESSEEGFHLGALIPTPAIQKLECDFLNTDSDERRSYSELACIALLKAASIAVDRLVAGDDQLVACLTLFGEYAVIAAIAYTLEEPPLYRELNEAVRKKCSPIYELLSSTKTKVPALPDSVILYRGCNVAFRARVGQIVTLSTFTSTSTDYETASIQFAGPTGTLIRFTGPLITGFDLRPLSEYPDEDEVLLFPMQTFKVQSIAKVNQQTVITLYSLKKVALEALVERDRFFPPDNTRHLLYIFPKQPGCLHLQHHDLAQVGYLPSPSTQLPHINHLPAYGIIRNNNSTIILNIAAVRNKYANGETVYEKCICRNSNNTPFGCFLSKVSSTDVKSYLDLIEQADPAQPATSYVLSRSPSDVQLVYDLMPKQYHHLLRVQWMRNINRVDILQFKANKACIFVFLALSFFICLSPPLQPPKPIQRLTTRRMLALSRARQLTCRSPSSLSPPQSTVSSSDAMIYLYNTARLLFSYAKLKFPIGLKLLRSDLYFRLNPFPCSICGDDDPNKCTETINFFYFQNYSK